MVLNKPLAAEVYLVNGMTLTMHLLFIMMLIGNCLVIDHYNFPSRGFVLSIAFRFYEIAKYQVFHES